MVVRRRYLLLPTASAAGIRILLGFVEQVRLCLLRKSVVHFGGEKLLWNMAVRC